MVVEYPRKSVISVRWSGATISSACCRTT